MSLSNCVLLYMSLYSIFNIVVYFINMLLSCGRAGAGNFIHCTCCSTLLFIPVQYQKKSQCHGIVITNHRETTPLLIRLGCCTSRKVLQENTGDFKF